MPRIVIDIRIIIWDQLGSIILNGMSYTGEL